MKNQRSQTKQAHSCIEFTNSCSTWNGPCDIVGNNVKAFHVPLSERQRRKIQPSVVSRRQWFSNKLIPRQSMPVAGVSGEYVVARAIVMSSFREATMLKQFVFSKEPKSNLEILLRSAKQGMKEHESNQIVSSSTKMPTNSSPLLSRRYIGKSCLAKRHYLVFVGRRGNSSRCSAKSRTLIRSICTW